MLNFIIQHFHHKTRNKQTQQPCAPAPTIERVVVEIDYDKLAEAMIAAQEKADEQKQQQAFEKQQEQQAAWEKALWCSRYTGRNWLVKVLRALVFPFRLVGGIIFFRKKNATSDRGTYALMRICNDSILRLYKWVFYVIAILCAILIADNLIPCFPLTLPSVESIGGYVGIGIVCFVIGRIIRIAQLEAQHSHDRNAVFALFNALVAFTAMIFGIVAVIIALKTGGNCICVQ